MVVREREEESAIEKEEMKGIDTLPFRTYMVGGVFLWGKGMVVLDYGWMISMRVWNTGFCQQVL